jgi:hypothetical protein
MHKLFYLQLKNFWSKYALEKHVYILIFLQEKNSTCDRLNNYNFI